MKINEDIICHLDKVNVSLGGSKILQDLSVNFKIGERVLVLGRNGSGKSTFLRLIAGLISPFSGTRTLGKNTTPFLLSHASGLYADLTIEENLLFFSGLFGVKKPIDDVLKLWGLNKFRHRTLRTVSKGTNTRTGLALIDIIRPSLLLLDEPTANLDNNGIELLLQSILSDKDTTIILATHDLHHLVAWGNTLLLLDNGSIKRSSSMETKETLLAFYHASNR
jgi:ABC-type multidrug transport system ATPase subunit